MSRESFHTVAFSKFLDRAEGVSEWVIGWVADTAPVHERQQ